MKTFTWRIKKLLKAQFKWLGYYVRATLQLTIGGKSKSNGRIQGGRASPSPLKKIRIRLWRIVLQKHFYFFTES